MQHWIEFTNYYLSIFREFGEDFVEYRKTKTQYTTIDSEVKSLVIVECCWYCTLPSFLRVLYWVLYRPQCAIVHFLAILLLFFFGLTYRDIFTLDTFHSHLILIILFVIKYELLQLDARVNGIYLLYHIPHCIDTIQELAQKWMQQTTIR